MINPTINPNDILARLGWRALLALASLVLITAVAPAQVPTMISYQGRVLMNDANFSGTGQFKFALVQGAGPTLLWKNDGSAGNTEPTAAVSLPVANGLVMTSLGDSTLANMTALPASAFLNSDVRLRVWFDGGAGFQQLTPDQRIVSVGYALMAGTVPDGSITAAKLAPGAISSTQLADDLDLGSTSTLGRLDIFRTAANTPAITLDGGSSSISTFGSDGLEQIRLHGTSYGELLLRNSLVNNATAVNLTAQGSTGGRLTLNNTNGSSRAVLEGENTGGLLTLYQADGAVGAILYGNDSGAGALSLRNTNGSARVRAFGGPTSGRFELYDTNGTRTFLAEGAEGGGTAGAQLVMYQADGTATIQLDAEVGNGGGGYFSLYEGDGTETVVVRADGAGNITLRQGDGSQGLGLSANNGTGGGGISIYRDDGSFAGQMTVADTTRRDGFWGLTKGNGDWGITARGQNSSTGGGAMYFRDSAGTATVVIDADSNDEGRIWTQVLTITGGSDLSENFDVNAGKDELKPGMVVSIDPRNPGELILSHEPYDNKVAGIVSGAGGVKTGMLMSQAGTQADGKHPVALTGRVYCWVDASQGAIEPGDMITTSQTPGHGMKATERERAFGSIIGKAMTGLAEGKGLVLVLVSLQ